MATTSTFQITAVADVVTLVDSIVRANPGAIIFIVLGNRVESSAVAKSRPSDNGEWCYPPLRNCYSQEATDEDSRCRWIEGSVRH